MSWGEDHTNTCPECDEEIHGKTTHGHTCHSQSDADKKAEREYARKLEDGEVDCSECGETQTPNNQAIHKKTCRNYTSPEW